MYDVLTQLSVADLSCNLCSNSEAADVFAAMFGSDSACNCVHLKRNISLEKQTFVER